MCHIRRCYIIVYRWKQKYCTGENNFCLPICLPDGQNSSIMGSALNPIALRMAKTLVYRVLAILSAIGLQEEFTPMGANSFLKVLIPLR